MQRKVFPATGAAVADLESLAHSGILEERLIGYVGRREGFDAELFRNQVLQEARTCVDQSLIITNERLSGDLHGNARIDARQIAYNLKAAFPEARLLMVTREQIDYILSLYAFRVAIRGHETRSFKQFVRAEAVTGLFERIEYDRLGGLYAELFGPDRVLALPMEMLAADPGKFLRRLETFAGWPEGGITPPTTSRESGMRRINQSTRTHRTIALSRGLNIAFNLLLELRRRRDGMSAEAVDPRRIEAPPYRPMRQTFYDFKRRTTARMERFLPPGRELGPGDIPDTEAILRRFADSNARFADLGIADWDIAQWGYEI